MTAATLPTQSSSPSVAWHVVSYVFLSIMSFLSLRHLPFDRAPPPIPTGLAGATGLAVTLTVAAAAAATFDPVAATLTPRAWNATFDPVTVTSTQRACGPERC